MPAPRFCPNRECPNHTAPPRRWRVRFGSYHTRAHGTVQRFRCKSCGATASTQTESLHYCAKLHLPLRAVWRSLLGGASQREIARRYAVSPMAIQHAILRLGRQAMAAQLLLLQRLRPRETVVFDGLRSFVSSQDYPCDLTTAVEPEREVILSITHSVCRRGGRLRPSRRRRIAQKYRVWAPEKGAMREAISLLSQEIWDYLRPAPKVVEDRLEGAATIDTDEHPLYRAVLRAGAAATHFARVGLFRHRRTPGSAPRTMENRLFAVNYVDRLLRHRLREHTRETIAFGRQATLQMHRAWIFACDHNCHREYRVKRPELGVHAATGVVAPAATHRIRRTLFSRRIFPRTPAVPETIRRVWCAELPTPPLRWRAEELQRPLRIPRYALRQLGC